MQNENRVPLATTRDKAEIVHKELFSPTRGRLQKSSAAFPYDPNTFLTSPVSSLHSFPFQVKLSFEYLLPDLLLSSRQCVGARITRSITRFSARLMFPYSGWNRGEPIHPV